MDMVERQVIQIIYNKGHVGLQNIPLEDKPY